jgi:hypothetical protein
MNPLTQFKKATSVFLVAFGLACFGLLPQAQAVSPPPDGGYPGENTAEGSNALFSLTTGPHNTANGFQSLFSNTTGSANTASGHHALASNTTGSNNTANGADALSSNTTGIYNTAVVFFRSGAMLSEPSTRASALGHSLSTPQTLIRRSALPRFYSTLPVSKTQPLVLVRSVLTLPATSMSPWVSSPD